ncbi:hypothetical protein GCM10009560_74720 [Nonomuraea longicatena]|uniref:Uncharacterized protein n=1 Tax=Nonomuraea longicatena TaxID=83682 RepID=A0ABN1R6V9_9ACTN
MPDSVLMGAHSAVSCPVNGSSPHAFFCSVDTDIQAKNPIAHRMPQTMTVPGTDHVLEVFR